MSLANDVNVGASHWVFLGDSITEGVGSSRVSYVEEVACAVAERGQRAAVIRLRPLQTEGVSWVNIGGSVMNEAVCTAEILLWNLACEGTTVSDDCRWLWLLRILRPSRIFVLRGALESIVRPAAVTNGRWPFWIPLPWRTYAAMDPRCYFSSLWWRRSKQLAVDSVKQFVRLRLLETLQGATLCDDIAFQRSYAALLDELSSFNAQVTLMGLPRVSGAVFPGSDVMFARRTSWVRDIAARRGLRFFKWPVHLSAARNPGMFYRDGFHLNKAGAHALAQSLFGEISHSGQSLA